MMERNGIFDLRPLGIILDRDEPGDDELLMNFWLKKKVFNSERHKCVPEQNKTLAHSWRMKERMKTVSVALVLCLNIGVDPPDTIKINPCAKELCWIDPKKFGSDLNGSSSQKPIEVIGAALQKQYERWQPRARYKLSLDPTMEDVKKLCTSLRRNAKDERVLFHFNGFGVPRPTENGEVWIFNKQYTKYIPLSVCDLHLWMGRPSIYVFDCSNAGNVVQVLKNLLQQPAKNESRDNIEWEDTSKQGILLAACQSNETLPQNPDVPADLFTACLTTPIRIALKWYILSKISKLVPGITTASADGIPGQLNDRRTMLGELNWIFTAITDTIAWNVLSRELFQKLFRQDLLVASLFRNYLLAERVMSHYGCTPLSVPALPSTKDHHMWLAWDYALDGILRQVPSVLSDPDTLQHSSFFSEQLTGFEVWLKTTSTLISQEHTSVDAPACPPPEQLPIVLQVLLSQVHRLRALDLLASFLDLGAWAVNLALSVGIFPYVLKLLQSSSSDLKPLLVFIWAKLLSVDSSCQTDLIKDGGHKYFMDILSDTSLQSDDRMVAAFVLSLIVDNYLAGQDAVVKSNVISTCLLQLQDSHPGLRLWLVLCLSKVWQHYDAARWVGVRDSAHDKLAPLLQDPCPEVRAATVCSLGTFLANNTERDDHVVKLDQSIASHLLTTLQDGSPIVREELLIALAGFVDNFLPQFELAAQQCSLNYHSVTQNTKDHRNISASHISSDSPIGDSYTSRNFLGVRGRASHVVAGTWSAITNLKADPHPHIATLAASLCEEIRKRASIDLYKKGRKASQPLSPSETFLNTTQPHSSKIEMQSSFFKWCCRQFSEPNSKLRNYDQRLNACPFSKLSSGIDSQNPQCHNYHTSATAPGLSKNTLTDPTLTDNFSTDAMSHHYQQRLGPFSKPSVGSTEWYQQDLLYNRAARVLTHAASEHALVGSSSLDDLIAFFNFSRHVNLMAFHPYNCNLAVVEEANIHFMDWEAQKRVRMVNNGNMPHTRITHLSFLNPHHQTLLLTATNEGLVKVWNVYTSGRQQVTSWVALNSIRPMSKSPGLVMDWHEDTQILAFCGNVPYVRLWDVNTELILKDIPLEHHSSCCTSTTFSRLPHTLVTGMMGGALKVFDLRVNKNSLVKELKESSSRVFKVSCPHTSPQTLLSACVSGEVFVHDLRNDKLLHKHSPNPPLSPTLSSSSSSSTDLMSVFDCHLYANLFVCNSNNGSLGSFNQQCKPLHPLKLAKHSLPLSHIALHPHKVLLATVNDNNAVCVYKLQGGKRKW